MFSAAYAKPHFKLLSAVFVVFAAFSFDASAQKKKTSAVDKKIQTTKQAAVKNQTADKKSAAKTSDVSKQTTAKKDLNSKDKSATAASAKTKQADTKKQAEEKRQALIRQAEAEARQREIEAAGEQLLMIYDFARKDNLNFQTTVELFRFIFFPCRSCILNVIV